MPLYATQEYIDYMSKFSLDNPTTVAWDERRGNLTLIGSIQKGDLEVSESNPLEIKMTQKGQEMIKEVIIVSPFMLHGD